MAGRERPVQVHRHRARQAAVIRRMLAAGGLTATVLMLLVTIMIPSASAGVRPSSGPRALPDVLDCKIPPTPEVPGRGVVGFFESAPKTPPAWSDPFVEGTNTSIYEQYGYAGLRWNTYDLGCGPEVARSPDAAVGTAVANWIVALPKAAVAATGAVLGAAFAPDFLGVFDPIISRVVDTLRDTVFEQWYVVVLAAMGLFVVWRARQASLASTAAAIGWAVFVMLLVTMVFRWPLVAGHAADETVTTTLGAVTGGLNDKTPGAQSSAGNEATAGMHEALLYQAWLGGTFGDANSDVARRYGPVIFDATALTWRQAQILRTDPAEGKKIIEAKRKKFTDAAQQIENADPDAYEYLTGQRSDTRVGYAMLAGLATLCAVPFLFVAGLLVLGALVIVRFGVMLFPAFATLGLFPTMRSLVTGIGSTVTAALINAMVFGIGAAVTVLAMGILLAPSTGTPPWLDIILMLLLTIVMWVALRPFRRLTQMISSQRNHFAAASEGLGTVSRSAARSSGRILSTALGTFLGMSVGQRAAAGAPEVEAPADTIPQRAEAVTSYEPIPAGADGALPAAVPAGPPGTDRAATRVPGSAQPAALAGTVQVNAGSVTVVRGSAPAGEPGAEAPGEIYAPSGHRPPVGSRIESAAAVATGATGAATAHDDEPTGRVEPTGRFEPAGRFEGGGGFDSGSRAESASRNDGGRDIGGSNIGGRNIGSSNSGRVMARTLNTAHPAAPATTTRPSTALGGPDDGRPIGEVGDRGFQRGPGEVADDLAIDDLDEIFRPNSIRQP
jgi:hypothetical protein